MGQYCARHKCRRLIASYALAGMSEGHLPQDPQGRDRDLHARQWVATTESALPKDQSCQDRAALSVRAGCPVREVLQAKKHGRD